MKSVKAKKLENNLQDLKELSKYNNTTKVLNSGETFTGGAESSEYPDVKIILSNDEDCKLYIEFSIDGSTWSTVGTFNSYTGRINPPHIYIKGTRYFRVRVENVSSNPATITLQSSFGNYGKLTAPINSTLSETYDASVVRPTDYKSEVAMGKRQGRTTWNKFGYNLSVPNSTTEQIIASWGGAFNPTTDIMSTAQTFTITYNNGTDGLGQTGALTLLIIYIDENFITQQAVHVLSNTGSDVTSFTGYGINRAIVLSNGGLGWNASNITFTATGDATTQAQIPALGSVTQQAIFHTQVNHNLLADFLKWNIRRLTGSSSDVRYTIKGYSYSRVTQTRYEVFRYDGSTRTETGFITNPNQPFVVGGREVLYFVITSDTNNTVVNLRFSGIEERVD